MVLRKGHPSRFVHQTLKVMLLAKFATSPQAILRERYCRAKCGYGAPHDRKAVRSVLVEKTALHDR